VRERKGNKAGHDAFHKDQDFVWIAQENRNNGKITKIRREDKKPKYRMEDQDRHAFQGLLREDNNCVKHRWWEPKSDRTSCLVHFVHECMHSNSDPLEVMYSSATAQIQSGNGESTAIWKKYMAQYKIDHSELPEGLRRLLSDKQRNLNSAMTRKKIAMIWKGVPTSTKAQKSSTIVGRKRKRQGEEDTNTENIHRNAAVKGTRVSPSNSSPKECRVVVVDIQKDIQRDALSALKEQYGERVPEIKEFGTSKKNISALKEEYGERVPEIKEFGTSKKNIGFVWTHHLCETNNQSVVAITEYPPSILDDTSIDLQDNEGQGWRKKRDSNLALWWWIIFNVPSMSNGRQWAESKLQDNKSVC
jgi:molybdopterin converting factor small subunit